MKKQKGFFEIYHDLKLEVIDDLIHKFTREKKFKKVEELIKMKMELSPNQ